MGRRPSRLRHLGRFWIGEKVRENLHIATKPAASMHVAAELTHGDECIDTLGFSLEKSCLAPELWGAPIVKRALETLGLFAPLASVAPQHMHGADQPVFVCHVERDSIAVEPKEPRAANQRHVVVVHHVEVSGPQERRNSSPIYHWATKLLRKEGRDDTNAAPQADDLDTLVVCDRRRLEPAVQRIVRIDVVNHCHMVAPSNQRP